MSHWRDKRTEEERAQLARDRLEAVRVIVFFCISALVIGLVTFGVLR